MRETAMAVRRGGRPLASRAGSYLPPRGVVLVAVDGARGAVEATIERDAVGAGEAAVMGGAHVSFVAADGGFAALQAVGLARVEAAGADALRDALLLVFAALVDGGGMALHRRRCGLGKANGGTKCKNSDAKQRNFHSVSPWEAAVCFGCFVPIRAHIH